MTLRSMIGERIRTLRRTRCPALSIHRLAVLADVDPGQLSRAERGLSGLSLEALARVAAALEVPLASLVDPSADAAYPEVAGSEPAWSRPRDEFERLVSELARLVGDRLPRDALSQCGDSGRELVMHHIRAAIEEGARRGLLRAEQEIRAIAEAGEPDSAPD